MILVCMKDRQLFGVTTVSTDLVNNDRLRGNFWTKHAISNQRVGSKIQRLIPSFNYPDGINGIGKKREAINPEPPNPDRPDVQFL